MGEMNRQNDEGRITAGDLTPIDFGITDKDIRQSIYSHFFDIGKGFYDPEKNPEGVLEYHLKKDSVIFYSYNDPRPALAAVEEKIIAVTKAAMLVAYHKGRADALEFASICKVNKNERATQSQDSGDQGLAQEQSQS